MESTTVKLYSLNYGNVRTYLAASLFIVGNILFPQFFHLIPQGGITWLPSPGFLRLKTSRVVDNLFVAPNTLTQRMVGPKCMGTVSLSLGGMKDGDRAGLSAFNGDSGVLTIEKNGNKLSLVMSEQKSVFEKTKRAISRVDMTEQARIPLNKELVYLRVEGDFTNGRDEARFSYSLDGKAWIPVGLPVKMKFDYTRMFMGSKFAIFNYATRSVGGYVDVDSFDYSFCDASM